MVVFLPFSRQDFITIRTFPFFSAKSVALHLALEARNERRLEAVSCKVLFGREPPRSPRAASLHYFRHRRT